MRFDKKSKRFYHADPVKKYRMHKVKKQWVVLGNVIGTLLIGASLSTGLLETIPVQADQQTVAPNKGDTEAQTDNETQTTKKIGNSANATTDNASVIKENTDVTKAAAAGVTFVQTFVDVDGNVLSAPVQSQNSIDNPPVIEGYVLAPEQSTIVMIDGGEYHLSDMKGMAGSSNPTLNQIIAGFNEMMAGTTETGNTVVTFVYQKDLSLFEGNTVTVEEGGTLDIPSLVKTLKTVDGSDGDLSKVTVDNLAEIDTSVAGTYTAELTYYDETFAKILTTTATVIVGENLLDLKTKDILLEVGDVFDKGLVIESITNSDGTSGDINNLQVEGNVNTSVAGDYPIKVTYTDPNTNQQISADVVVTVKEQKKWTLITRFVDKETGDEISPEVTKEVSLGDSDTTYDFAMPAEIDGKYLSLSDSLLDQTGIAGANGSLQDIMSNNGLTTLAETIGFINNIELTDALDAGTVTLTYVYSTDQGKLSGNDLTIKANDSLTADQLINEVLNGDGTAGDKSKVAISIEGTPLNQFSTETPGTYTITYTYPDPVTGKDRTATSTLTIEAFDPILVGQDGSFYIGEQFDNNSLLAQLVNSDGSAGDATNFQYDLSNVDFNTPGTYEVTLSYTDPITGKTVVDTVELTVEYNPNHQEVSIVTENDPTGDKQWEAEGNVGEQITVPVTDDDLKREGYEYTVTGPDGQEYNSLAEAMQANPVYDNTDNTGSASDKNGQKFVVHYQLDDLSESDWLSDSTHDSEDLVESTSDWESDSTHDSEDLVESTSDWESDSTHDSEDLVESTSDWESDSTHDSEELVESTSDWESDSTHDSEDLVESTSDWESDSTHDSEDLVESTSDWESDSTHDSEDLVESTSDWESDSTHDSEDLVESTSDWESDSTHDSEDLVESTSDWESDSTHDSEDLVESTSDWESDSTHDSEDLVESTSDWESDSAHDSEDLVESTSDWESDSTHDSEDLVESTSDWESDSTHDSEDLVESTSDWESDSTHDSEDLVESTSDWESDSTHDSEDLVESTSDWESDSTHDSEDLVESTSDWLSDSIHDSEDLEESTSDWESDSTHDSEDLVESTSDWESDSTHDSEDLVESTSDWESDSTHDSEDLVESTSDWESDSTHDSEDLVESTSDWLSDSIHDSEDLEESTSDWLSDSIHDSEDLEESTSDWLSDSIHDSEDLVESTSDWLSDSIHDSEDLEESTSDWLSDSIHDSEDLEESTSDWLSDSIHDSEELEESTSDWLSDSIHDSEDLEESTSDWLSDSIYDSEMILHSGDGFGNGATGNESWSGTDITHPSNEFDRGGKVYHDSEGSVKSHGGFIGKSAMSEGHSRLPETGTNSSATLPVIGGLLTALSLGFLPFKKKKKEEQ